MWKIARSQYQSACSLKNSFSKGVVRPEGGRRGGGGEGVGDGGREGEGERWAFCVRHQTHRKGEVKDYRRHQRDLWCFWRWIDTYEQYMQVQYVCRQTSLVLTVVA